MRGQHPLRHLFIHLGKGRSSHSSWHMVYPSNKQPTPVVRETQTQLYCKRKTSSEEHPPPKKNPWPFFFDALCPRAKSPPSLASSFLGWTASQLGPSLLPERAHLQTAWIVGGPVLHLLALVPWAWDRPPPARLVGGFRTREAEHGSFSGWACPTSLGRSQGALVAYGREEETLQQTGCSPCSDFTVEMHLFNMLPCERTIRGQVEAQWRCQICCLPAFSHRHKPLLRAGLQKKKSPPEQIL